MGRASHGERAPACRTPDHWQELARTWEHSGPPLRVSPQDVEGYAEALATHASNGRPLRALLLGVTPEIHGLPRPQPTDLVAVDRSAAMIAQVWPGAAESARCAEWTALPFPPASRDVALCDGGLHLLDHPRGQQELARSLRRVVVPGGLCVLRVFAPPARPESAAAVLADLREGAVRDLNVLKLRLAMALQHDPRRGVRVDDVWRAFREAEPDTARLVARTGWTPEHVETIDAYRGSDAVYHFVAVDDVVRIFGRDPGGFVLERVRTPTYLLGDRCPLVVLRRTAEAA
jgi:SAM-dependent methyltransferase